MWHSTSMLSVSELLLWLNGHLDIRGENIKIVYLGDYLYKIFYRVEYGMKP
jgi:hypothetical protein